MKLRLGVSIKAVEAALGKPESIQVFDNPSGKEQLLWYGEWHLEFSNGRLAGRYRY